MTGRLCCVHRNLEFVLISQIDVRGKSNKRFAFASIAKHGCYNRDSIMIWVGVSTQGKTDLHVIENGTLTAVRCCSKILDIYIRLCTGSIGSDFILMDNNTRPHHAQITNEYLAWKTITEMDMPARSPDINSIKFVWDMLQIAISGCRVQSTTIVEFRVTLIEEEWS